MREEDKILLELEKDIDLPELESSSERLIRGIVFNTDEPSMLSLTFRVLLVGFVGGAFLAFANAILSFRTNSFTISPTVVTLLAYPIGIFLSKILPKGCLNPGPFTIKEHALITIFSTAASAGGSGIAYGLDNVVAQYMPDLMNDRAVNFWNSLIFMLTTQLIGFGLSGLTRRFLVRPAGLIWPTNLSTIAMLVGFHEKDRKAEGSISRFTMFGIAAVAMFIYQFVPNWLAPGLQAVSLLCLIPGSYLWRTLSSPSTGVGIGALTFDWAVVSRQMPMTTPWWATVNYLVSTMLWSWVITPLVYSTNPWGTPSVLESRGPVYFGDSTLAYPFNTMELFQPNGTHIAPVDLMDPVTFDLKEDIYNEVQHIYISPFFALSYLTSFMALTAAISHVIVWHGSDVNRQMREAFSQTDDSSQDIHNDLMKAYPDIPDWMYLVFLALLTGVQIVAGEYTPFRLPWWTVLLGLLIPVIFILPIGIIQAISGTQLGLNVITEFLIGLLLPGKTITVMAFKSFSYNAMIQALSLTAALKMGHHMHINPIHMVICQIVGTIVGAVFNLIGAFYAMDTPGFLGGPDWKYINYKIFYSAGAIWGAISPARFFSGTYAQLMLAFPIGLVLPWIPWLLNKYYPSKYWHLINFPLITFFSGPGALQSDLLVPLIIGWFSQYYLLRYKPAFFERYNYVIAGAFDAGSGLSILLQNVIVNYLPTIPFYPLNPDQENVPVDYYCFGLDYQ